MNKQEANNLIDFDDCTSFSPSKKIKFSNAESVSDIKKIGVTSNNLLQTSPTTPSHIKKYQIMIKTGVPSAAVKQKMVLEGMMEEG